ncbi:MAG: type VII secretion protein EssC [Blautia sp.]|nr:type VII secretion protein EssC [Blautia sp.]
MGMKITFFTKEGCREERLPDKNNEDHYVVLPGTFLGLNEALSVHFEVLEETWRICPEEGYALFRDGREVTGRIVLSGNGRLEIRAGREIRIPLLYTEIKRQLYPFSKYHVPSGVPVSIGRSPASLIRCRNSLVSSEHAVLIRRGTSWEIRNLSENGVYVNDRIVWKTCTASFGDRVHVVGLQLVLLGRYIAVDCREDPVTVHPCLLPMGQEKTAGDSGALPSPRESGITLIHRSPRIAAGMGAEQIEIEEPPSLPDKESASFWLTAGPSLTMMLPMLLGSFLMALSYRSSGSSGGTFLYAGILMTTSSAVLAAFWALFQIYHQRKEQISKENESTSAYERYLAAREKELRDGYDGERQRLLALYPAPLSRTGTTEEGTERGGLWNRNPEHGDFLALRLGLGEACFSTEIRIPPDKFMVRKNPLWDRPAELKRRYQTLRGIPILLDLLDTPLIGLVGGTGKGGCETLVRTLAVQAAAADCYTDLRIAFVSRRKDALFSRLQQELRWLPHVWKDGGELRYMADNEEDASGVLYDLVQNAGIEDRDMEEAPADPDLPHFLLFLSDASLLEDDGTAYRFFRQPGRYRITTLILADEQEELPNECACFVQNDEDFRGIVRVLPEGIRRIPVDFDRPDAKKAERFARHLSNCRVRERGKKGEIPDLLTFFDMYQVARAEELGARERWLKNRTTRGIRGMLGRGSGGETVYLDIHERYHGPHGLVAGTTGSGKSETLQTFILSLAVQYSPDAVCFFVIDYKGGGMAGLLEGLPHMIGEISNLSERGVRRAMVSIKSENKRRQRIFREYGINHIDAYTELYRAGTAPVPIPHLILIVDEFAELKREEPEFMQELISVAQVGRSLGVHLILATQKPAGTVDEHILSNTRFRICLRVQDRSDSLELLHRPDAAGITRTGRGYLQVGNDERFELFQSGYSGALCPSEDKEKEEEAVPVGLSGRPLINRTREGARPGEGRAQLEAVREYLKKTADSFGFRQTFYLWLPYLPACLPAAAVEETIEETGSGRGEKELLLGMLDDPENQTQIPLTLLLPPEGHLAVFGLPRSGRTVFLQQLLLELCLKMRPSELFLYILDYGSGELKAFSEAPHTGGYLTEEDADRTARMFRMLRRMLNERKKERQGADPPGSSRPAVLLVIDHLELFREQTKERYEEDLRLLFQEGPSAGLYLVLSANGIGTRDLPGRYTEYLSEVFCLEMADRYGYMEVFRGTGPLPDPERGIPGRGAVEYEGRVLEFQTILPGALQEPALREEFLKEELTALHHEHAGERAIQIPSLPERPETGNFAVLPETIRALESPACLPCGYDMTTAEVFSLPLDRIFCFLITGSRGTGRRNFLNVLLEMTARKNGTTVFMDRSAYGNREMPGEAVFLRTEDEIFRYFRDELTPLLKERNQAKQSFMAEGMKETELFRRMSGMYPPVFLLIPDLEWFLELVYRSRKGMQGFVEMIFEKGALHNLYFFAIAAGNRKKELSGYPAFRFFVQDRQGIRFGGRASEDSWLDFEYLDYREQSRKLEPGIGQLSHGPESGPAERILVPLARG